MTWTVRYINNQLMRFPTEYQGIADSYVLQADGTWVANAGGGSSTLGDLSDVSISGPSVGQTIIYTGDGTTHEWENAYATTLIEVKNAHTIQDGDEQVPATITKGQAVYVSGTSGAGKPEVKLADADGSGTHPAIGLVYDDILGDDEGLVIAAGVLDQVSVTQSAGTALYLSTTAGSLTGIRPTASTEKVQKVALVTRTESGGGGNGSVIVMGAGRTNDINNELVALLGTTGPNDTNLGTFTGTTIADNETVKGALQDLETAVEASDILQREFGHPIRSVSSTSLTNLLSYTISGGDMSVGDSLTFSVKGEIIQNSGASQNVRVQTRVGGSALTESATSFSDNSLAGGFEITGEYVYTTDSGFDQQFILINFRAGNTSSAASGLGNIGTIAKDGLQQSSGAQDMSAASFDLEVRGAFDTNSSGCSINVYSTEVRINRKP